jgi:amino acid transporter
MSTVRPPGRLISGSDNGKTIVTGETADAAIPRRAEHMTTTKGPPTNSPTPVLRRTLSTWGAISLSIAAMGASLAVNINPQGAGATVGRAVPLTFILATVGVVLVAYGFARVCSRLSHAGSVFGLTGVTIGPRAGVVAGWSLLGAYFAFTITTSMTAGIFGASFLQAIGLWHTTPAIAPWLIAVGSVAVCLAMAISPVKRSMRTLLWVEVLTASLIVLIGIVVFIRVASGHAPHHQPFTLNMFTVPPGVGTSTLFLGIVFGFLSFAGFEAAATLGEEATDPRRAIPRAIFGVALFGGIFYTIGTAIEMLGFGTTTKGVAAFASSSSLFGTLGAEYVTPAVGDIVTLGTTIAAIGCCLATLVAAARLLFAMSRGGVGDRRLSRVSEKSGVPAVAAAAISVAACAVIILIRVAGTSVAFNLFAWSGTVGTLVLLVAYGIFTAGAWYYLCVRGPRHGQRASRLDFIIPVLGLVVLGYTLYRNVLPWPSTTAGQVIAVLALVWVGAAIAVIVAAPRQAARIGGQLAHDEGLVFSSGKIAQTAAEIEMDDPQARTS